MKPEDKTVAVRDPQATRQARSWFRIGLLGLSVVCLGLSVAVLLDRTRQATRDTQPVEPQARAVMPLATPRHVASQPKTLAAAVQPPRRIQTLFPEPTPRMRRFVEVLASPVPAGGFMTETEAAAWRKNLEQLVQQGANAVPAIREFLAKNTDFDFGDTGKQALGYASARGALIDALGQIGGPLAVAALSEVLQSTADPQEIALLAQNLEKLEPGLHQQAALDAARQTLAMAGEGKLPDRDVAPLFELLQQYGGSAAAVDLARDAGYWNFYATMALAQLPDDAGIPSLIELAAGQPGANSGTKAAALQLLTQAAAQSADARTALLELARQNRLSAYDWATLTPMLSGDRIVFQNPAFGNLLGTVSPNDLRSAYMPGSNPRFYTAPLGALTTEQINQQTALVDDLLSVTTDPAGVQALQKSKALLSNRLVALASSTAN